MTSRVTGRSLRRKRGKRTVKTDGRSLPYGSLHKIPYLLSVHVVALVTDTRCNVGLSKHFHRSVGHVAAGFIRPVHSEARVGPTQGLRSAAEEVWAVVGTVLPAKCVLHHEVLGILVIEAGVCRTNDVVHSYLEPGKLEHGALFGSEPLPYFL